MRIAIVAILTLVCATAASGQCPSAIDTWSTTNGTMLGGRASEAWCGADGNPVAPGQPGNTQNAMSWDGATLGGQWKAWGMQIDANGAVLIADTVVGGNGSRTYRTHYTGGVFWLSGSHTWSDGVDLAGDLTSFLVIATITYVGGVPVGATSNITFTGGFSDCPEANNCEITFTIANAMLVWRAGSGLPMPANYPPLLCGASAGEMFDVCCISMQINCAVDAEPTSWGGLKAIYR